MAPSPADGARPGAAQLSPTPAHPELVGRAGVGAAHVCGLTRAGRSVIRGAPTRGLAGFPSATTDGSGWGVLDGRPARAHGSPWLKQPRSPVDARA